MQTFEINPTELRCRRRHEQRQIVVAAAPFVLEQVGIREGTIVEAIEGRSAYVFMTEVRNPLGRTPQFWDFVGGTEIIRLGLIKAASDTGAISHNTTTKDKPRFRADPRPVFENLPEYAVSDRRHHIRPPRKAPTEWLGSWHEPDDDPNAPARFGFLR